MDGAASDLRLRDRTPRRRDRRRHRRDRPGQPTRLLPRWHPYSRCALREQVEPEQEIGPQLELLGIRPRDVRWLILTHLHTDHAGGLRHFPGNQILVTRSEAEIAAGLRGRIRGYTNDHFPRWFAPTLLDLPPVPFGAFPTSLRMTKAGDVIIVPLPGHTRGQIGVLVEEGDHSVLIAGDSAYSQQQMLNGLVDGVTTDEATARLTHQRIRAQTGLRPTVYVVAHDPQSATRLAQRTPVPAPTPSRERASLGREERCQPRSTRSVNARSSTPRPATRSSSTYPSSAS